MANGIKGRTKRVTEFWADCSLCVLEDDIPYIMESTGVVQPGLHQRCTQSCGDKLRQGKPDVTERTGVKMDIAR